MYEKNFETPCDHYNQPIFYLPSWRIDYLFPYVEPAAVDVVDVIVVVAVVFVDEVDVIVVIVVVDNAVLLPISAFCSPNLVVGFKPHTVIDIVVDCIDPFRI